MGNESQDEAKGGGLEGLAQTIVQSAGGGGGGGGGRGGGGGGGGGGWGGGGGGGGPDGLLNGTGKPG